VELLTDPFRAVTTASSTLLVFDIDQQTVNGRAVEDAWVAVIEGIIGDLVVAQLHSRDLNHEPWFDLVVLDLAPGVPPAARLTIQGHDVRWRGPASLWRELPRFFAKHRRLAPEGETLVRLMEEPGQIQMTAIPDDMALRDWEWPLHVAEILGDEIVLGRGRVGMALVFYDPDLGSVTAAVPLPGTISPSARPKARPGKPEIWVACDNILVRIDGAGRSVTGTLDAGHRGDYIADFAFDERAQRCAVALGWSGRVVDIDAERFTVRGSTNTAESLTEIVLLEDGRFVGRTDEAGFVVSSLP
jgi:hypothetical protein